MATDGSRVSALHAPAIPVVALRTSFISPTTPTTRHNFFLSALDIESRRFPYYHLLFFYRPTIGNTSETVQQLQESLSSVLVEFYPLAGRLTVGEHDGRHYIDCNDAGALFVEAATDASIDDLEKENFPMTPFLLQLIPMVDQRRADNVNVPLVGLQVTMFQGSGFAVGLSLSHVAADGLSFCHFMQAWAECCRGVPITVRPTHERALLKITGESEWTCPPSSHVAPPGWLSPLDNVETTAVHLLAERLQMHWWKVFSFTTNTIAALKSMATNNGSTECTSFEALAAHVSLCLTKVYNLQANDKVELKFWMNGRRRLLQEVPLSYFGNCYFPVTVQATAGELLTEGILFTANLIHQAIRKPTSDAFRSWIEELEKAGCIIPESPSHSKLELSFVLSTRAPLYSTDFGWGEPVCVRPGTVPAKELVMMPGKPSSGVGAEMIMLVPKHRIDALVASLRFLREWYAKEESPPPPPRALHPSSPNSLLLI